MKEKLWVEKYRPKTFNDYIFHNESHKKAFLQMVKEKSIPHLLLSGVQGSGKTTLARLLLESMGLDDTDVLHLNASDENNVETVREKIKNFISTYSFSSFKVVYLEEADYLTPAGQAIMRGLMEDYADVARFLLTCNYENKIKPAIRSRCQHFRFKAMDKDDIAEYAAKILLAEDVKFSLDELYEFISVGYPDIRKIIHSIQQNVFDGQLQKTELDAEGDYKFEMLDLLQQDDWVSIRTLLCNNVSTEEWEGVYRFLYENLDKCKKFSENSSKKDSAIVIIAEHLSKHSMIADAEINAAAMFIRLANL